MQNCRIFIHQSIQGNSGDAISRNTSRRRSSHKAAHPRRRPCTWKMQSKTEDPSCVLHPRETRWIGIPIQYSRLSSTSSLTATRSTLQIWSVRKKENSSSSRLPTLRPLLRHWDIPTSAAALGVQENGNFNEDEKTDSPRCPLQSGGKQKFIGTTICRCGAEIKEPNRISKKNSSSHARGPLRQHQGLAQLEIIPQRLRGNPTRLQRRSPTAQENPRETLEERRTQGAKLDAAERT